MGLMANPFKPEGLRAPGYSTHQYTRPVSSVRFDGVHLPKVFRVPRLLVGWKTSNVSGRGPFS